VLVEGRLRQRSWETDGVKRSKIEVVADNVQFLGGPRGASAETGASTARRLNRKTTISRSEKNTIRIPRR